MSFNTAGAIPVSTMQHVVNSVEMNLPPTSLRPPVGVGAINSAMLAQISQIGLSLRSFISNCDMVLCDLNNAYNTETLDASTSNNSLVGYFISSASYQKNISVAAQVDSLQQEAVRINNMLTSSGLLSSYPMMCMPLSTDFNGWSIRQAESSEHNLLADMFTSCAYSSMASTNTMNQIAMTSTRVNAVRQQAAQILQTLYSVGMQQGGHPFAATRIG